MNASHGVVWMFLCLLAVAKGFGWNHDLSGPVRDACCRDNDKCCPYGYRCDPKYRNCVRINELARPEAQSTHTSGGSRGSYLSYATGRQNIPSSGFSLSQGTFLSPDNCPTGSYCWDVDTCCMMRHGYNNIWSRVEATCCSRNQSPNCQRSRGCRVTLSDRPPYKGYRETFTRRPVYYGAALPAALPSTAVLLLAVCACVVTGPIKELNA